MSNVFVAGDDLELTITATLDNGETLDLTGCNILFHIRKFVDSGTAAVTKSTGGGGGIDITFPTRGVLKVVLTNTDTAALEGKYFYELKITDALGKIKRLRESDGSLATIIFNKKLIA